MMGILPVVYDQIHQNTRLRGALAMKSVRNIRNEQDVKAAAGTSWLGKAT